VASAVDAWVIRGPGLLLKQGLIGRSGSSRGGGSGRERNRKREGTTGRRGRCDVVSGYTVERVQRQRGDERVRAWVVRGISHEARFRGYSTTHPYKGLWACGLETCYCSSALPSLLWSSPSPRARRPLSLECRCTALPQPHRRASLLNSSHRIRLNSSPRGPPPSHCPIRFRFRLPTSSASGRPSHSRSNAAFHWSASPFEPVLPFPLRFRLPVSSPFELGLTTFVSCVPRALRLRNPY
jgi:hypothetical protein